MRGGSDLRRLADLYRLEVERRGLARTTTAQINRAVARFVAFLRRRGRTQAAQITPQELVRFRVWAGDYFDRLGPWRGRRRLKGLSDWMDAARSFCRWLVREDHLLIDPTVGLEPVRYQCPVPRVLSVRETESLLAGPDTADPLGLRDRAVLELLYSSGLRAGELVRLDLGDVDHLEGELLVRRGKGGKSRRVPVGEHAVTALAEYLERVRPRLARGGAFRDPRALFLGQLGARFDYNSVRRVVTKYARAAHLGGSITPHTLRHTAAVHLIRGGADVRHVQEFLGHVLADTTAHYTRLSIDDLKEALVRCHPRRHVKV